MSGGSGAVIVYEQGVAIFDSFQGVTTSGLGLSDTGETWVSFVTGFSIILVPYNGTGLIWRLGATFCNASVPIPIKSALGFNLTVRFSIDNYSLVDQGGISFAIEDAASFSMTLRLGALATSDMRLSLNASPPYAFAPLPVIAAGLEYNLRMRYTQDLASTRIWEDGTPEPDGWDLELDATGDTPGLGAHTFQVHNDLAVIGAGDDIPLYLTEIAIGADAPVVISGR